jgi:hypothetical protein
MVNSRAGTGLPGVHDFPFSSSFSSSVHGLDWEELECNVWDEGGKRGRQADGRAGRSYVRREDQEVPVMTTEEPLMGAEPLRASGAALREHFGERVRQFHATELTTFRDEKYYERDTAQEARESRATGAGDSARGPASPLGHHGMARDVQADLVNSWVAELDESCATIRRLECEVAQHRAEGALPRPTPLGGSDFRRSCYGHLPLVPASSLSI